MFLANAKSTLEIAASVGMISNHLMRECDVLSGGTKQYASRQSRLD